MARVVLGKPRGEAFLLNGNKSSAANLVGSLQKTLTKSMFVFNISNYLEP